MLGARSFFLGGLFGAVCGGFAFRAAGFIPLSSTLFVGTQARDLAVTCRTRSPGPVQGIWSPSDQQLAELENRLLPTLCARLSGRSGTLHAEDFIRQYAGFVIGGRRIVYVNGVHRSYIEKRLEVQRTDSFHLAGSDWQHEPIVVCDGGAQFFGVEYDTDAKTFKNFEFNIEGG